MKKNGSNVFRSNVFRIFSFTSRESGVIILNRECPHKKLADIRYMTSVFVAGRTVSKMTDYYNEEKHLEEMKKMKKVVKFGGSSLANADQFKKVGAIIGEDESRRYVVPSAPGKRFSSDIKVTDMLYACYEAAANGSDFTEQLEQIKERYQEIIDGLNLSFSLDKDFEKIREDFSNQAGQDYAASRGEFLNGKIMAAYLDFDFVDAAEVVRFDDDGSFNADITNDLLSEKLKDKHTAVIPGFYGAKEM